MLNDRRAPAGNRGNGLSQGDRSPPVYHRSLSGWGGWPRSTARVLRPRIPHDLAAIDMSPRGTVARGLGRSYGDAAQLSGGTVMDMTALAGIIEFDSGVVTAWAGTSLGDVLADAIPKGWFLPVTPGTRHVTLGGAIAADVHGKNHHRDGSFGNYVDSLELFTADGQLVETNRNDEAFDATVGGMGLTGTIIRATIRLLPIESSLMVVDTHRADDIHGVMERLLEVDRRRRYSVAWLDLTPKGRGRGIVLAGDHARLEELPPSHRSQPLAATRARGVPVPKIPGAGLVNEATVKVFNRVWFGRAPSHETGRPEPLDDFFYPLDRLAGWNRVYGERGFLQYQFVVPPDRTDTLTAVAEKLATTQTPVSLAVLKRMGPSSAGMLSFPMEGWTLAVDLPLGEATLGDVLDQCDRLVADAGGRVYFAKDSRLLAEAADQMYQTLLPEWRQARARLDPLGVVRSDLSERLSLIA